MMVGSIKSGVGMAIYTLVVALIVIVINIISFRHYQVYDMTGEGLRTLAPQTVKIIESIKEPITIYAFVRPRRNMEIEEILERYSRKSKMLSHMILDPDKQPGLAKKYNVEEYGTFVVETKSGRRESGKKFGEEEITNAIYKATTSAQKKVYVLTGHNERSLSQTKPMGWSGARAALESAMYDVVELNWYETGEMPDDADLLIIPGPRVDMRDAEIKRLAEYLEAGRKLLVTLDPVDLPNLEKLLLKYGLRLNDDMILDPLSQRLGFEPLVATVSSYPDHPVVRDFTTVTFFPVARSVTLEKSNEKKAELSPIAETDVQSWGETDLKSINAGAPVFSKSDDHPGPLTVAASAQWEITPEGADRKIGEKPKKARMIVVGDSDFASNSTLNFTGNRDLFLNMAGWLLEEENRISIRPKTRGFHPVLFTDFQLGLIFWVVVVAIPALVAAAGVMVRIRRRKD